jgi:hypothetical protein
MYKTEYYDRGDIREVFGSTINGWTGQSESFMYPLERIIERLKGWKEKFLSLGGKEILLKAIVQSILVYAMGVFKIPKGLCKEMNDAMSAFWWGDTEEQEKLHWCAWWRMCIPKKIGGMGFRDLYSFNLAMLASRSGAWLQIRILYVHKC